MLKFFKFKKRKYIHRGVDPDEIFLDAKNLPDFDTQQFEGRIEHPISKKTFNFLAVFLGIVSIIFFSKIWTLEVVHGEVYKQRSENNSLDKTPIFASRGVIYDRNNIPLATNEQNTNGNDFPLRSYIKTPGFGHLLGYVSYPKKDKNGFYLKDRVEYKGMAGVEKQFNSKLSGTNGQKIIEVNVSGAVQSENITNPPIDGDNIYLSIDSKLENIFYKAIKNLADSAGFTGGAGLLMDVENGELLVLTSYPEYNPNVLSLGLDSKTISSYNDSTKRFYLNRALSGLYTPGSIVKPFFSLAALNEKIIDPLTTIYTTGSISVPNPFDPKHPSVFNDHGVFGNVDMRKAIAVSSDVYFYEIGGGYGSQKGLGISNLEKYSKLFGFNQKTGIDMPGESMGTIPSPEWKAKNFKGDIWRIGDTYHTSIGQYGTQVTPIEMVRAAASIANGGNLLTPHILYDDQSMQKSVPVNLDPSYFKIVKEGMRQTVTSGTAVAINLPYVAIAAKTGTAQVGIKFDKINSWVIGFFPYDHPRYAFTILMEASSSKNKDGATTAMREIVENMQIYTPEYFK